MKTFSEALHSVLEATKAGTESEALQKSTDVIKEVMSDEDAAEFCHFVVQTESATMYRDPRIFASIVGMIMFSHGVAVGIQMEKSE